VKITKSQVDEIIDIMRNMFDVETDDETFRSDYSGRGMYGKTCIGFVISSRAQLALGAAIAITFNGMKDDEDIDEDELELGYQMITRSRADTMAFDVIVYFPDVELEEDK